MSYHSENQKSAVEAQDYLKTHNSNHRYLAYRDIPKLIKSYFNNGNALDYGCGLGYSTNFLVELGFDAVGVDVSDEMIKQARLQWPAYRFDTLKEQRIPYESNIFDVVLSSFVLFELKSLEDIVGYLKEAKRVMKTNGVFVAVTGSCQMHRPERNWVHFGTNYPENNDASSGGTVRLFLKSANIEFTDYCWNEKDYRKAFEMAGFCIHKEMYPLGRIGDRHRWQDELRYSPYLILSATKGESQEERA